MGNSSACPSKCNPDNSYKCVITWDKTAYGGTLYIITTHKWFISKSGTGLIFDSSHGRSLHLVPGIGEHTFRLGVTLPTWMQSGPVHRVIVCKDASFSCYQESTSVRLCSFLSVSCQGDFHLIFVPKDTAGSKTHPL